MITDLIVTWPRNCDYPLWREFIRNNRPHFNEIIIGMHNSNTGVDFTEFIKSAMHPDYVLVHQAPEPKPGEDWRNLAVNASLMYSYNAPWIWFTEQDFYPDSLFWDEVAKHEAEGCGVIAYYQSDRMHPCCIFVKREVLNQTRKNFGIIPNVSDHFSMFQADIEALGVKVGHIDPSRCMHFNGLSQNWYLATIGKEPNYHLDEFLLYLSSCLEVEVPHSPDFDQIARAVIEQYKPALTENYPNITIPSCPSPTPQKGSAEATGEPPTQEGRVGE